ncbi:hypothetical protein N3K66_007323 [Trichothecium roseum]|uniref:Uncharacterized protein n=1 Tax=Trichothecium roseum TaxID=47278 RepID=A0ACC0UW61_9HYPO|nr:hypothetical protein N3K66_007323 [Trichothecium roseum]
MPVSTKPTLGKLTTPVSATFPSEITSATSVTTATTATPLSAVSFPLKPDPDYLKTPISPPSAYTDFLTKAMALNSPTANGSSGSTTPDITSAPRTSASEHSDCSCKQEEAESPTASEELSKVPPATAPIVPPSPYASLAPPMSAPPTGPTTFPSQMLPASPALSNLDSPMSALSPWSARSGRTSVFDWDAALKARFSEQYKKKSSRTSVRHIREVVTRTVTYTPRMEPAPRGKRRKVE